MESLRYEVLEGVKTADGRVLCPPLEYDEEGEPTTGEFVQLRPSGTVKSWSWVPEPRKGHPFDRPFAWALIQIDGTDNAMVHAVDAGKAKQMRTGMRVRLRWADEKNGTIRDIACFEPISPFMPGPQRVEYDVTPGKHYTAYLRGLEEGKFIGAGTRSLARCTCRPAVRTPIRVIRRASISKWSTWGSSPPSRSSAFPFPGQKLTPPYCFGAIVLDGSDSPIYHLISGVPYDEIRMGMRVKAKWKPQDEWETSLENILYFEPTGEPDVPFDSYKEHL